MPKESSNALTGTETGIIGNMNGNDNTDVPRCSNDVEGSIVESHFETMPSADTPKKFTMSLVSDYWDSDSDGEIVEELNINKNLLPIVSIKEEVEDVVEFEVSENVDFDIEETVETVWQNIDEDGDDLMETETLNIDKDLLPVVAIKEEEEEDDEGVIEFEVSESVVGDIVVEKAWQNTDKDGDIVETACYNIDKNLLPIISTKEEIVEFEVLVSEFEVTESETQENKKAPIDISSRSTKSSEPLNEEKTENYRSTVTIESGTDDSESDSDDSSSDDSSSDESSSSSDSSTDSELEILKQQRKDDDRIPYTKGEMLLSELPPIENLTISVNEDESQPIGTIFSVVNQQVVIQAFPNVPPIDLESVLFLENGKRALGKVFDVFGQVHEPFYTVRFNSAEHIDESGVKIGDPVFFAPQTDHTHFVVLDELMKIKGSDASWEDNNEPPSKFVEYSDDEKESQAKQQRKQKKLGLQERIPSNEYRPQRKRFRPQGPNQNQNPFSDMGNRPYRGQVRFPRGRPQQPWVRPSGPNYSTRAMAPNMSVPPPGIHTGPSANMERHMDPSYSPDMSQHQNPGSYGQWGGGYQFGAPPQFPQVGPGSNWNHNNGPSSYMGPPPNHGGPSHMRPRGNNAAPHPQHNYHCPPPSHPGPHNPNHGHAYSSQENWLPSPPGIFHQPPPPPPNPGMAEWNSTYHHS